MADLVHDAERLAELQALPLDRKIMISQTRIIEWYQHYNGQVCVSFSGGKDSTVLLHLVRSLFPDVKAVFSNTGLEYPAIQQFVKSVDNVDIFTPSMRFDHVISEYGYPLIGKEVAEAIYYARRIRSQSLNVERERERESNWRRLLSGNASSWTETDGFQADRDAGGGRKRTLSRQDHREAEGQSCKESGLQRNNTEKNRPGGITKVDATEDISCADSKPG